MRTLAANSKEKYFNAKYNEKIWETANSAPKKETSNYRFKDSFLSLLFFLSTTYFEEIAVLLCVNWRNLYS